METWKAIDGKHPYEVSDMGRVRNADTMRVLKPCPNAKGYMRVQICGKKYRVHRLVAAAFIPNPRDLPQINHKDGNKGNNSADNLEWCDQMENYLHAVDNGLVANRAKPRPIVVDGSQEYKSVAEAARATGSNPDAVRKCLKGECLTAKGHTFQDKGRPIARTEPRWRNCFKPVIVNGERYESVSEAARCNGVSVSHMSNILHGRGRCARIEDARFYGRAD